MATNVTLAKQTLALTQTMGSAEEPKSSMKAEDAATLAMNRALKITAASSAVATQGLTLGNSAMQKVASEPKKVEIVAQPTVGQRVKAFFEKVKQAFARAIAWIKTCGGKKKDEATTSASKVEKQSKEDKIDKQLQDVLVGEKTESSKASDDSEIAKAAKAEREAADARKAKAEKAVQAAKGADLFAGLTIKGPTAQSQEIDIIGWNTPRVEKDEQVPVNAKIGAEEFRLDAETFGCTLASIKMDAAKDEIRAQIDRSEAEKAIKPYTDLFAGCEIGQPKAKANTFLGDLLASPWMSMPVPSAIPSSYTYNSADYDFGQDFAKGGQSWIV